MAGYSQKSLAQKLGLKGGMRALLRNMPPDVLARLQPLPKDFTLLKKSGNDLDYVHCFAESAAELEAVLPGLKAALRSDGMLWVSWRKGRKEFSETHVRQCALAAGLVDVKVCAVDETWSGLKLVIRLRDRKPA
jgi:hypothetical protein